MAHFSNIPDEQLTWLATQAIARGKHRDEDASMYARFLLKAIRGQLAEGKTLSRPLAVYLCEAITKIVDQDANAVDALGLTAPKGRPRADASLEAAVAAVMILAERAGRSGQTHACLDQAGLKVDRRRRQQIRKGHNGLEDLVESDLSSVVRRGLLPTLSDDGRKIIIELISP